jgi:GT2 family glycosyltransferase
MEMRAEVAAVVPTLGGSRGAADLGAALASLRRQGTAIEVTVVHQATAEGREGAGSALSEEVAALADRVLTFPAPLGFAAAANAGMSGRGRRYLLLLNDDAELQPGWLAAARAVLDSSPTLAAVQGVNLAPEPTGEGARRAGAAGGQPPPVNLAPEPTGEGAEPRVEGSGIGWNRWWQAVQLGAGGPPPPAAGPREVFGASAAAALFRSSALAAVALPGGVFDPRLHTYYEDVDLAGRLRGAGYQAALAPAARARHRGGASGGALGRRRLSLLYANRWLALARLLGDAFAGRLPRVLLRDLLDGARHPARLPAVLSGWARARRHWGRFARPGPPLVPLGELRRLAAERLAGRGWPPAPAGRRAPSPRGSGARFG